jgi:hypothetical protein
MAEKDLYYVTLKVRREVYERLIQIQSLLQFRDKRRYGMSKVIEWMLNQLPELKIPIEEPAYIAEEEVEEEGKG